MPQKSYSTLLRFALLTLIFAAATPAAHTRAQATTPAAQTKTSLHLRWPAQEGVLRYRLQLARDEQFQDIVFDRAVFGTEYVVTELGPGRYFWRFAPAVKETGTFSPARPIEIAADAAATDSGGEARPRPTPGTLAPASNTGWRTTTGLVARPLVAHLRSGTSSDVVGVNSDGMVYGLDGTNGVALWTARFRPNAKRGEPTGNGGAPVFTPVLTEGRDNLNNVVVAFDGGVRAIEGSTGRELWRAPLASRAVGGAIAAPADGGARALLVAGDNSSLTVIDPANGKVVSEAKLDGAVVATPTAFPLGGGSGVALALAGGTLEVRDHAGQRVRVIKMDTNITTPALYVPSARAALVLVGTENGLISLGAEDLKPLGRIATESDAPAGTLSAADLDGDGALEVLMLTRRGRLVAVGTTDGRIKWYTPGATDASSAAFADLNSDGVLDVLVAGGQDFARGFSGRDGSLIWKAEEEAKGSAQDGASAGTRALVTGTFGAGSTAYVVGTDTARTGLRAVGLPKDSVKAAKE
ncbi:MAG TPA: PQQ-binding-like beta-propeller repeat protein [Pyrinomonadaceae bacterium]|nr:PQQ-binding-like beta-propeller repeat protein [Pyrinomonadaceae bacterium]